jgi:molybdate transport system regulatory protein
VGPSILFIDFANMVADNKFLKICIIKFLLYISACFAEHTELSMKSVSKKYTLGFRVWINEEQGHFIGTGRVRLLENIRETGSITNAAKAMKMSYRQAWQMVEDMNSRSEKPLVEKILGGKGGGGALVTETGEKTIKLFYKLEEKVAKLSKELSEKINL